MSEDIAVSNLTTNPLSQTLHPQWRSRLRLCIAAKENSTLSMALHEEMLQSHLPLDINSASISSAKCEEFTSEAGSKVNFPHYDASYQDMYDTLEAHPDGPQSFGEALAALKRNASIKNHAESFYDLEPHMMWDLVVCVDTSVFDEVVSYFMSQSRTQTRALVVYAICIPTTDPKLFVDIFEDYLFHMLEGAEEKGSGRNTRGWQDMLDDGIALARERTNLSILHFSWIFR